MRLKTKFLYLEPTEVCLEFSNQSTLFGTPPEGAFQYTATGLETGEKHEVLFLAWLARPGRDIRFRGKNHCIEKKANEVIGFSITSMGPAEFHIGLQ